jgi:bifunctional DNA-binding transcriptional regulator/antitoxin component of YhaV-PrlF toxin-antitoxin module
VITSKLTSTSKTTIPRVIRAALCLCEGDEISYTIEGNRAIMTKALSEAVDYPFSTFDEWVSDTDRESYSAL